MCGILTSGSLVHVSLCVVHVVGISFHPQHESIEKANMAIERQREREREREKETEAKFGKKNQ